MYNKSNYFNRTMKQTAVEWLALYIKGITSLNCDEVIEQAKEMEKTIVTEYAEFCVRCDRAGLPLVKFEDWVKELTFKSEKDEVQ